MRGFFSDIKKQETKLSKRPGRLDCDTCGLFHNCRSPKMRPTGKGKKGILVIAEAPGAKEDETGIQLIGPAGQTLRRHLERIGIDLEEDCIKTNALSCRPMDSKGNNRSPQPKEIACCRSRVWKAIEEFKPKLIILLGNEACESMYGHRWKKDFPGIMTLRGWSIPDRELNCWVCPTFHPSFVMRSEKQETIINTFRDDLKNAIRILETPFPKFGDERKNIIIHKEIDEIKKDLESIILSPPPLLYLDFEASGLKPHVKGHHIKTVSFCWDDKDNNEKCIAFPYSEEIKYLLVRILKSKNIKKAAHNVTYEKEWSWVILGCKIENMVWDSALAAHILDSRPKVSGLKFQVFVKFGKVDYASHLDEYLVSSNDKNGNAFNRIDEAPIDELLIYNGLDSLYGKRLAIEQMEKLNHTLHSGYGYSLFHEGIDSLIDMESVSIDKTYCEEQFKQATQDIKNMEKEILNFPEVVRWKQREGNDFNLYSSDQLKYVLFEDLKLDIKKYTEKNNAKVDKNTLDSYSTAVPFVKDLIKIKEMKSARDVYLKSWLRESVDGKIHPMFSLLLVSSYRSSCSHPNLQNVPMRDKEKQKMLRTAIIPSPGRQIMEADFKQIEVRVAACYTQDPMLIEYCKDSSKDMHRDMAMELFLLPKELVNKDIRHTSKNKFVFPEFYGDYYKQVAVAIWEEMEKRKLSIDNNISLRMHLSSKGITRYEEFEEHIRNIEDNFWKIRFKKYYEWKWNTYEEYLRKGYVDSLTGFRYSGPLEWKQICNLPIQGSAFHCLLWCLNRTRKIKLERNWKSNTILQIHDSQIWDTCPIERKEIIETIIHTATKELLDHYKWIIVPMGVDIELSEVNQSWYNKKAISNF